MVVGEDLAGGEGRAIAVENAVLGVALHVEVVQAGGVAIAYHLRSGEGGDKIDGAALGVTADVALRAARVLHILRPEQEVAHDKSQGQGHDHLLQERPAANGCPGARRPWNRSALARPELALKLYGVDDRPDLSA